MKNKMIVWLIISFIMMLLLPLAAVTLVPNEAGMAVSMLLFFVVNPLYFTVIGIFAGRDLKKMWSLPILSTIMFLLGVWFIYDMGEWAFLIYMGIYLILSSITMLITYQITRRIQL